MSTVDPADFFATVAAKHARCFWLDGGGAREWSGRRSIIGWLDEDDVSISYDARRREVTRHTDGVREVVGDDVFTVLEAELAAGTPADQWFGFFGYASRPDLPAGPAPGVPDAVWMRAGQVRMFEHPAVAEGVSRLVAGAPRTSTTEGVAGAPRTSTTERVAGAPRTATTDTVVEVRAQRASKPPPADYAEAFGRVQQELHAGNSYEVNLTYRIEEPSDLSPAAAYLRLRELNPAPYAGFLQHDVPGARVWLLSSSPERYALIGPDRNLETKPIKGTTARGRDPVEDEALRRKLLSEPRFRSENLMIVDLLRNDLSMVCEPGTVEVPALMQVESYETVHQLVSTVRGRLRDDVTTIGALRALFPAGSMTGAPKLRTMQIIDAVEATPRGVYAGAFGWISGSGAADLGVVIRSLVTAGDGHYVVGAGGGITVQSDVVEEYAESALKAERLLRVFDCGPH